jgi:hypothetical protein
MQALHRRFPLTRAGYLEWVHIPTRVPLPLEALFRSEVDVSEPYDRTTVKQAV